MKIETRHVENMTGFFIDQPFIYIRHLSKKSNTTCVTLH